MRADRSTWRMNSMVMSCARRDGRENHDCSVFCDCHKEVEVANEKIGACVCEEKLHMVSQQYSKADNHARETSWSEEERQRNLSPYLLERLAVYNRFTIEGNDFAQLQVCSDDDQIQHEYSPGCKLGSKG